MTGSTILSRFSFHVEKSPNHCAVKDGDNELTYAQLDNLSSKYAAQLKSLGIVKGDVVALSVRKSLAAYILILACIKLGTPYFFLDLRSSPARNEKIVDRAKPRLIVSEHRCVSEASEVPFISLEDFERDASSQNASLSTEISEDDIAYIMFTSGSTGEPKGAMIQHRGIIMLADWASSYLRVEPRDVFSNLNPLHFDNSVFDIFCCLLNGATLAAIDTEWTKNIARVVGAMRDAECTVVFSVPTFFRLLLRISALEKRHLPHVRLIQFGGEGFPISELRKLRNGFPAPIRLVNVYGPTECSCICSGIDVDENILKLKESLPPLGVLNPGFAHRILDPDGSEIGYGKVGELWLAGKAIGKGYINAPEETESRFHDCSWPEAAGDRMYKTGDLVRIDPATSYLMFVGRADNQVKVRGYRIELEEVDAIIESIAAVERAVSATYATHDELLEIGCIVALKDDAMPVDKLQAEVSSLMPNYMTPSIIEIVTDVPRNRSGKIDRQAASELLSARRQRM